MAELADLVVVGAGGVGSAVLAQAARRGLKVVGLDRFEPPHALGSSHGDTRIIRLAYFESPDYVALLQRSYALWEELEAWAGEQLYWPTGILEVGPPDGNVIPGIDRASREHGLALETLSPQEVAARFPGFRVPAGHGARFETQAGFLRVEACVAACLRQARAAGARLVFNTPVTAIERVGPERVRVRSEGETFEARRVVVCAGAWTSRLLRDLRVDLRPRRQPLFWFEGTPELSLASGSPVWFYETDAGLGFYGFPGEGGAVKVAQHGGGELIDDPAQVDRDLRAADLQTLQDFLPAHLPSLKGAPLVRHVVCLYTESPDGHFVVDRHPDLPELVFAAGLSGHGYKMASGLAEALLALATDEPTPTPMDFLGLARFT